MVVVVVVVAVAVYLIIQWHISAPTKTWRNLPKLQKKGLRSPGPFCFHGTKQQPLLGGPSRLVSG